MPWNMLTNNLKQAFEIARSLDIGYIWIDSLCIIQGSEEDWAREANKMHLVYRNSCCNIAIADSVGQYGGAFRNREPTDVSPVKYRPREGSPMFSGKEWRVVSDQIRQADTTPLQFKYEAANCRIYYTLDNIYNMTRLWYDVSAAAFVDSSLSVDGSTGFSKTNNTNPTTPPKHAAQRPVLSLNITAIDQAKWDDDNSDSLQAGVRSYGTRSANSFPACTQTSAGEVCFKAGSVCRDISVYCSKDRKYVTARRCLSECRNQSGSKCSGTCQLDSSSGESKPIFQHADGSQFQERLSTGFLLS